MKLKVLFFSVLFSMFSIQTSFASDYDEDYDEDYDVGEDEDVPDSMIFSWNKSAINYSVSGTVDGYEYVDLGLPSGLKWAASNIGAKVPVEYGEYLACGEVGPKDRYDEDNSFISSLSIEELKSKSIINEDGNLTALYDAAAINWSENWRLPTVAEFEELINNCVWSEITLCGVKGYRFESKKIGNNNWIFLPLAGDFYRNSIDYAGSRGSYWSSTMSGFNAYYLYLGSNSAFTERAIRFVGCTVRPVVKE